jgi:hypothetical protein
LIFIIQTEVQLTAYLSNKRSDDFHTKSFGRGWIKTVRQVGWLWQWQLDFYPINNDTVIGTLIPRKHRGEIMTQIL